MDKVEDGDELRGISTNVLGRYTAYGVGVGVGAGIRSQLGRCRRFGSNLISRRIKIVLSYEANGTD